MAERLGKMARKIPSRIRNPDGNHYSSSELQEKLPNREPITLLNPEGDGNCLPRALSNAVYGTEDYHKLLRNAVCNFIMSNFLPSESSPRDNKFHKELAKLRRDKVWIGT